MKKERALFEAWLSTVPNDPPAITVEQAGGTKGDDRYLSPSTSLAWSAWKASRIRVKNEAPLMRGVGFFIEDGKLMFAD